MSDGLPPAAATILVVDDSQPNVKLLRLILTAAGYRVIGAYSGPEALEMLHRERPDAMLLDVRMPGMSGYEVCRKVREDPEFSDLPVIMVTALSMAEQRIAGIEAGATDFISKPFNKKELLARVRASLMTAKPGGIVPQLPGAVLIAAPDWRILALSPAAANLLGIAAHNAMQPDFTQWLGQAEKDLLAAGGELADFRLPGHPRLAARQTTATAPDGEVILRLIALVETK
ncbi:MAG TPA: response regulator [Gallionella sp.]|nr:response regulator [Gallionella sp.]